METFSTATTPALPVELTTAILENLQAEDDGKQGLLAFRLASKDFATLAASPLFRILNLSRNSGTTVSVMSLLKERPDLAALVQEINFDIEHTHEQSEGDDEDVDDKDENGNDREDGIEKVLVFINHYSCLFSLAIVDTIKQSVSIFSHLHLFPTLKALRLYFPSSYEDYAVGLSDPEDEGEGEDDPEVFMTDVRILQIKILNELAKLSLKPNALNTIRTFDIHGLITLPNRGARLDGLNIFLQGITNLSISTIANSHQGHVLTGSNGYRSFWTNDIIPFLTAPANLTSFELTMNFPSGSIGPSCAVWDSMNWPNLRSLSLGGVIFNDFFKDRTTRNDPLSITGVEAFILRHPSLVELELQNCFLSIDMPNVPSPRMWADILKGFEDKLVNLQKFTLFPIPYPPHYGEDAGPYSIDQGGDNGEGYVRPVGFFTYDTFFPDDVTPPKQDVDLDGLALKSLQAAIIARLGSPYYLC